MNILYYVMPAVVCILALLRDVAVEVVSRLVSDYILGWFRRKKRGKDGSNVLDTFIVTAKGIKVIRAGKVKYDKKHNLLIVLETLKE